MIIPKIHTLSHIIFKSPEQFKLKNNIPIFFFKDTKNPIIKIDMVFDAGRWTEDKKITASAMSALGKSGTEKLSSFELNEEIDKLGATLGFSVGLNTCTLSMSCLSKFLEPVLDLATTCLNDIVFPEKEIDIFKTNTKAKLSVDIEKTDYLSNVIFREKIFGVNHPYGYRFSNENIDALTRDDILNYYQNNITPNNCTVFVAGDVNEVQLKALENVLTNFTKTHTPQAKRYFEFEPSVEKYTHIKKEKSTQSSISIGKVLFNKKNPDYAHFLLLNTIFGGYFGSRLMSNIREDKGLTYGIYSLLSPLKHDGFWAIHTDTNINKLDVCLNEIYLEIDRLQNDTFTDEEIQLARNYLLGRLLKRTDGAFNLMETFKSYFIEGIDIGKFEIFIDELKQADATSLSAIAKKYLSLNTMHQVIVG